MLRLEALEDRQLLAVFTVNTSNDLDAGSTGSLRWAIEESNTNPGFDNIRFSLPGTKKISLDPGLGELPTIDDAVSFDGNNAGTNVTIDGSQLGGASRTTGLRFEGTGSSAAHSVSNVVVEWFDTGIVIADTLGSLSNNNTFDGVTVDNTLEVGIHIENPFALVRNSTVTSSSTGVLIDAADAKLSAISVTASADYGIHIRAENVTVIDSIVSASGGHGIGFTPADSNDRYTGGRIESSDVSETAESGIYISSGVRGIELVGNRIHNTGQDGVRIASPGSGRDFDAIGSAINAWLALAGNESFNDDAGIQIYKDGKVVYEQFFGSYSRDLSLSIASGSKLVSAAAIMTLLDDGWIGDSIANAGATGHRRILEDRLNTKISDYLPEFKVPASGGIIGDAALEDITLGQSLSHMSGLVGFDEPGRPESRALIRNLGWHYSATRQGPGYQLPHEMTLENETKDIAFVAESTAAPGERFAYGGVSFQVAGRVAEKEYQDRTAADSQWIDLFRDRLADPLGMTSKDEDKTHYGQFVGRRGSIDHTNPRIAAGMSSTIDDYGRLLAMLLNDGIYEGKEILSREAVELMFTNHRTSFDSEDFSPEPLSNAGNDPFRKYGLGAWLDRVDSQGNGLQASSPGADGFWPWIDFENGYSAVLMVSGDRLVVSDGAVQDLVEGDASQGGLQHLIRQQLVSPTLDGDVDRNGIIDAEDETIIDSNLERFSTGGATWSDGDLNGDGFVDSADRDIWDFFKDDRNVVLRGNRIYEVGSEYDLVSGGAEGTFDFEAVQSTSPPTITIDGSFTGTPNADYEIELLAYPDIASEPVLLPAYTISQRSDSSGAIDFSGVNSFDFSPIDSSIYGSHLILAVATQVDSSTSTDLATTNYSEPVNVLSTSDASTIGMYDPSTATFFLRNSNSGGAADVPAINFGSSNWMPLAGDWNGDGIETIGAYNSATATVFLRNANDSGIADTVFNYGIPGWIPLAGDWDGDGTDSVAVYNPATATFFLRNTNDTGVADVAFNYGSPGWTPLSGDWNADQQDTVGVFNADTATFFLRNVNSSGTADVAPFNFGGAGWIPLAGDWNGDGTDTIGVVAPETVTFYLRDVNEAGAPDITPFQFGVPGWIPLVGNWDGSASTLVSQDAPKLAIELGIPFSSQPSGQIEGTIDLASSTSPWLLFSAITGSSVDTVPDETGDVNVAREEVFRSLEFDGSGDVVEPVDIEQLVSAAQLAWKSIE